MVDVNGNTDLQTSPDTVIDPDSTNPTSVIQTSTLGTTGNGGVDDDGFEISGTVNGSDIPLPINVAVVIDTSGSTADPSGSDFDGNGTVETILEAELIAAQDLFDAYVAAGYSAEEVTISIIDMSGSSTVVGTFNLGQASDYTAALQDIAADGPSGGTNFDDGLDKAIDAFNAIGTDDTETNVVVFMSDGFPTSGGSDFTNELNTLQNDFGALVQGIGIGENSSLDDLNLVDNTGGAQKVLSGEELANAIVQPLTNIDFLRFEILVEGVDANGDPITQTIILNEGDPEVIATPVGWAFDCVPIDDKFQIGSELTVTVTSVFAEDPGDPGSGLQTVVTQHQLFVVACFMEGTMILTPMGEVPVESLEIGDRVITRDHGVQRIRWIGASTFPSGYVAANPHLRPILFRKDAFEPGVPDRDLRVSRQHRILVRGWRAELMFGDPEGVLVPAFALCNDHSIVEERPTRPVTYVHMAFDRHEVIYSNGVESESFHPEQRTVAGLSSPQRDELLAIFPELERGFAYDATREELRGRIGAVLSEPRRTPGTS
ncbi:von Willebrand factor type A domain protein [Pseudoruegeria aquimaris]|uniref:von Willebrand factor type A domain protein n=1 Tax=Pseudoruegeria aquimaris TaxID=393663 RepID=A0A1Y5RET5_9RHOB|nr:Hint domain-containing protein [Pseudoruegeria aquimaris]SLN13202.1 von Willebrand factor type A domain protein [Pseudoruegeria aquimaris]